MAGMNCTAWNSVRANAETNRPSAVPSTASTTATTVSIQRPPDDGQVEQPDADADGQGRLQHRHQAEGERVAEQEVELAHRHREQPLQGAGGALAQRGHRGDQEHHHERDQRQQGRARAGRSPGRARPRTSTTAGPAARTGSTSSIARVRWSRRSWVSTRVAHRQGRPRVSVHAALPPRSTRLRNACSMSSVPVCRSSSAGAVVGDDPALAHQQQPVAAGGLVHHVAGDEHAGAVLGEPVEGAPQVHRAAPGPGPTVGSSSTSSVGLAEQGDGERDPRALAAGELGRRSGPAGPPRSTVADAPRRRGPRHPEDPGEEGQVLGHGEVVVHARLLGDVADPVAQGRRAGRCPEHLDGAAT